MKMKPTPDEAEAIGRKPVLTVPEAAWVANIATGTLYRRWREGGGPESFKIGKSRRIRRAALDRWITAQEKQKA